MIRSRFGLMTLPVAVLMLIFGLVWTNGNTYAEDDGSGGWNTSSYFEISVIKKSCQKDIVSYGWNNEPVYGYKCDKNEGTETVKIAKKGESAYKVNDGTSAKLFKNLSFVKQGNETLTVSDTSTSATWQSTPKQLQASFGSDFTAFRNDAAGKFGEMTISDLLGQQQYKYTFSVGEIKTEKVDSAEPAAGQQTQGDSTTPAATCMNSGGLGTLGWILCPSLDLMSGAADLIYTTFLEPALQVDPQLFTDKGNETIDGWWAFRNIANVLFIVLFLVIIFSQLTGVGIDNYGIKKILPKMILAAILINLSYWICIAFVDISNILGNAFQALFDNLSSGGAKVDLTSIGGGSNIGVSGTLISAGILAALMGGGYAVFSNPAIMVTLVISALGVLIAILFLFILLAAREAAIVVLVVLSPLAIACYMLPNTKTVFDKWLKLFGGLLLVYPIAGLLVGGGNYVSELLLKIGQGDSGAFAAFTAMIIGIVPIFFIPTVLKSAFSAMGNIGAKISGIGQRVGSGFTGAARNSQAYKNVQERGLERRTRIQAGLDANGNPVNMGRLGRAMRGGRRNVARNRSQYLKDQDTERRANYLMGDGFGEARLAQLEQAESDKISAATALARNEFSGQTSEALEDAWVEARNSGNLDRMEALTNVMTEKVGGKAAANFIAGQMGSMNIASGNEADIAALSRINQTMRRNSNLASGMMDASPDAYQMAASDGMGDGTRQDLSWFSKNQKIATKNTDFAKMSVGTVDRMVAQGGITQRQAQAFLASTDKDVVDALSDGDKFKAWRRAAGYPTGNTS